LKSSILQAAGINLTKSSSGEDAAATAMRQGETVDRASKTNPKEEAIKSGIAESSIDQAA
jgi:hypothetical protein